jgi:hypothetical protein
MSEVDLDGALNALASELPDEAIEAPEVLDEAVVEDNPVEQESFTGFDPSVLPDDLQQVYKSMQADYTRKTQEVAEIRRQAETFSELGVDPEQAVGVVELFQRLQSDPQFATEFVSDMQRQLEQAGYASRPVVEEAPVNNSYENLPPELASELEEMRRFRQEMAVREQQAEIEAQLESVEQQIRLSNPQYSDDDIDAIYNLAYATDGDLMAAQEQYHAIQQRLLGNYLQSKQVPQGMTPVSTGPSSSALRDFKNLDEAHKAAMEVVRNIS